MKLTKETPKEKVIEASKECRKCGHCCSYGGGIVLEEEIKRLAQHIKIDEKSFKENYLDNLSLFNKEVYRTRSEKNNEGLPFGKCVFLSEKECRLHEVKPLHCRVGTCSEDGNDAIEWFYLNHIVNKEDPQSIREWAARLEHKSTIPGGKADELITDKNRLKQMLNYDIIGIEKDYGKELGFNEMKKEFDKAVKKALEEIGK